MEAWEEGLATHLEFPLNSCLEKCRLKLEAWNKTEFGHVGRKINELQKYLEWLELQPASPSIIQDMKNTRVELNCWHEKEDNMWYQRSRINWYHAGDRNTHFFHAKASARQKKNYIEGLLDSSGCWHEDEDKMGEIVVEYYKELFSTSHPTEFTEIVQAIQPKVTLTMNQMLAAEFKAKEVQVAVKEMYPLKAPGPDGMPSLFYQHFWPNIGEVVTKTILDFLNNGIYPPKFNETHIVLISKIKEPKGVMDYRPISLCNVVFRITSKVIANRLKKILPYIISDTQSAFVQGRLITDNILVAFESMHHIHQKKGGKKGEMALKLDMSKAYDRVEWDCLEKIMAKLGFDEKWRNLIMRCVSSVS